MLFAHLHPVKPFNTNDDFSPTKFHLAFACILNREIRLVGFFRW